MANQFRRFNSAAYRLLVSSDAVKTVLSRNYRRQKPNKVNVDPRKNVQYPYVKGDPLQEDMIRDINKESSLTKLKNRDKEIDNQKKLKMNKHNNFYELPSGLKFEKISEGDVRLGQTIMKAKSNQKKINDSILLEGQRLIKDSLLLGAQPKSIYFCDPEMLNGLPTHLLKDVGLYKIVYKDMKIWSDAVTPAGILGVFQKPQQGEALSPPETTLPITLILDSLKDPGNVGTLIRTAAAVGCQRVIATRGTVNAWDCKVLRSAMGGHFSVPIYTGIGWSEISSYVGHGSQVYLANTQQSCMLTRTFDYKLESRYLDEALQDDQTSDSDSDEDSGNDSDHEYQTDLAAERKAKDFKNVPLAVCDYSAINLAPATSTSGDELGVQIVLILGGETEGLSSQAKRFAYSYYGSYVSIPMCETVNSLNASIAGSIILYELRNKILAAMAQDRKPSKSLA